MVTQTDRDRPTDAGSKSDIDATGDDSARIDLDGGPARLAAPTGPVCTTKPDPTTSTLAGGG